MPDTDDIDFENDDDTADRSITLDRSRLRSMEKRAKQAEEAEKRAAEAERRAAFAEAGIKLSDPKMSYFVKGYDGELTADAITAAATEAGFLAPITTDDSAANAADLAASERVSSAASGSSSGNAGEDAKIAELFAAADKGRDALVAQIEAHGHPVMTTA